MGALLGNAFETRPARTVEERLSVFSFFNLIKAQPDVIKQNIKRVTVILLETIGTSLLKPPLADLTLFVQLFILSAILQFQELALLPKIWPMRIKRVRSPCTLYF